MALKLTFYAILSLAVIIALSLLVIPAEEIAVKENVVDGGSVQAADGDSIIVYNTEMAEVVKLIDGPCGMQ